MKSTIFRVTSILLIILNCRVQSTEPVNINPVILPEYKVTVSKSDTEFEEWSYATWDDFEVISCAGSAETIEIIQTMRAAQYAIQSLIPAVRNRANLPFCVIIHGKGPTRMALLANRDPNAYQYLISFPVWHEGRRMGIVSGTPDLHLSDSASGPMSRRSVHIAKQHFINRIDQHFPPLPRWFHATIRELISISDFEGEWDKSRYARFNTTGNKIIIGNITTYCRHMQYTNLKGSRLAFESSWLYTDKKGKFVVDDYKKHPPLPDDKRIRPMPMQQMLAQEYQDFKDYPPNFWVKQCLIFWHYCYLRKDAGQLKEGYLQLVQKATEGPITENIFRKCMGMGFAEMESALFNYWGPERAKQGYENITAEFSGKIDDDTFSMRKATKAEVARIKGEALAFQGKLDLARKTMLVVYDRKKADPALCGSLGVLEYRANDLEKARPLLAVATQAQIHNPEAYRTLARIKLDDALGVKKGKKPKRDIRLSQKQIDEVYELLRAARQMPPIRAETYLLLNELLSYMPPDAQPTPEQAAFVAEGRAWFPDGKNREYYYPPTPPRKSRISDDKPIFPATWTESPNLR